MYTGVHVNCLPPGRPNYRTGAGSGGGGGGGGQRR